MTASDELFRLIKSLTKHEKIYFKKFSSLFVEKESSNYLKLFNEMDKQGARDKYDEAIIKEEKFSGKFIKNLPVHKNYLYNMILTSLSIHKKENRERIIIRQLLTHAEILIDKMLYGQAKKILIKAFRIASDNGYTLNQLEIINIEKSVNKILINVRDYETYNKENYIQQLEILGSIKSEIDYSNLYYHCGNLVNKIGTGFVRNKEDLSAIREFFNNELLNNESSAKSFTSKHQFYTMKMQFNLTIGDYDKALHFSKKITNLHHYEINEPGRTLDKYLNSLNNMMTCQIRTNKFDEFEHAVNELREIGNKFPKKITAKNRSFIFYSLSVLLLSKYQLMTEFDKLRMHISEVENEIAVYESDFSLSRRIIIYYFLATSNFVLSNFEKCLYWSGKIINLEKTDSSSDYQCYSRIVYLISYYELGYLDSIENALRSVYHFLSKHKSVYKYENIILKYLRQTFRIKNQNELYELFEDMKIEMEKIYNDPFEKNAFDAFNILFWLESKLTNKSVMDIMAERNNSKIQN